MEDEQDELKQILEQINNQIDEGLENLLNNQNIKLKEVSIQIKTKICDKNYLNKLKTIREIPKIDMCPELMDNDNFNFIINPILFCLATLDIITEFSLKETEDNKKILNIIQGNNSFIDNFISLMKSMREKNLEPQYKSVHRCLSNILNNVELYMSQDPEYIITTILKNLQNDINLVKEYIPNIIADNFLSEIKKIKKCTKCKYICWERLPEEENFVFDLFLREPVEIKGEESLSSTFSNLLSGENEDKMKCQSCKEELSNTTNFKVLKNYLILNINRDKDPNNEMKLKYSNILNITDSTEKEYKFELILALTDIETAENNLNIEQKKIINKRNKNNFKIFFKNFINNKYYKFINGKFIVENNGNMEDEISQHKPNILIYKKQI